MNLSDLSLLSAKIRTRKSMPSSDGSFIESELHVADVGHVVKNFIDCGGKRRTTAAGVLQTWVAENDKNHRLLAGKLAKILDLAVDLFPSADLPVEIEYEGCNIV